MYGVIYLVTCLENGKRYVGQTTAADPLKYWQGHLNAARKGSEKVLYEAIRKYGAATFSFEVIWHAPDKISLDLSEDALISLFETMSPNGYNLRGGGSHGKFSIESKAKISSAQIHIWSDLDLKEKHRAATKTAMARPDVKERCAVLRGRRFITNGTSSRTITDEEEIPSGWHYGTHAKSISGRVFITNGDECRRIYPDEPLPRGWRYGGSWRGTVWITDGNENRKLTTEELPEGWQLGFTITSPTHSVLSGLASAGSRWITNGSESCRIFLNEVTTPPSGWWFGRK